MFLAQRDDRYVQYRVLTTRVVQTNRKQHGTHLKNRMHVNISKFTLVQQRNHYLTNMVE